MDDAGVMMEVVGVMLVALVIVQVVMISALKRELRECRRKMGWRVQVDAGKKDLAVVR